MLLARATHWDIFCQVIDNYGDIGVCWRLACDLQARGQAVRLWLDDASHLPWLAPDAAQRGIPIIDWHQPTEQTQLGSTLMATFGCALPPAIEALLAACPPEQRPLGLNIEHLSAEAYVERMHGLPSPRFFADGSRWDQYFFYPGFSTATGGLLREADLIQRQAAFDKNTWLAAQNLAPTPQAQLISLFCYEPAQLQAWLQVLREDRQPQHLLICAGRGQAAFSQAVAQLGLQPSAQLNWSLLPLIPQTDFDHLLWACDVNMVRGEDSWLRAIWAGKPFVWQIYEQDDAAHHEKLSAFMDRADLPMALQRLWRGWNGLGGNHMQAQDWQALQVAPQFVQLRDRLLEQHELSSQLRYFVRAQQEKAALA
ncbi:MAG: elongation factor P maturation arginine rhamnosyltransferase EarP [Brachymonas sp.]